MVEKILVLNGSHSEIPIIEQLKKMEKYVITTGNLPNSFVHRYADKYIQTDYSDMNAVLKIAEDNEIDGIVSCANDFGIITAAYVSEKMGLKGHDSYKTTLLLHQKDLFKDFALSNNMRVPPSRKFDSISAALNDANNLDYPLIVKPVDLTGGKGVSCVVSIDEYETAVRLAYRMSRKKVIVVEKFITGTYHSFSTFVVDKKVIAYFCDNEYSNVYRFFVDTSVGPADCIEDVKDILIEQAELVAKKLDLVNGVFHMQYVIDEKNIPYIIDVTRRCSGDIYPEPVEHATGLPWSKWIVMSELGYASECFHERGRQSKICGRHCIMADREGIVDNVVISEKIRPYIYKDIQWWGMGTKIENHVTDKLGIVFYEFPNKKIMMNMMKNIKSLIRVKLK